MATKTKKPLIRWLLTFPIVIFFILAHTYHVVASLDKAGVGGVFTGTPGEYALILYSYVTLITLILLVQYLTQSWRWLNLVGHVGLLLLYSLLSSYLFGVHQSFDVSVMVETGQKAADKGVFQVIANTLSRDSLVVGGIAIAAFILLEVTRKTLSSRPLKRSKLWAIILVILYSAMLWGPLDTRDEVTHFFRTGVEYFFKPLYKPVPLKPGEYPYLKTGFTYTEGLPRTDPPPHVFLIMIESFNHWAVNRKGPDGDELTPVYNQLINQGLYIDHYYGNSMLSIKGYGVTMSGIWPALRGFIMEKDSTLSLHGMPAVFNDNGYYTAFFQAQLDPAFHYTNNLMTKMGFQHFDTLEAYLKPEDEGLRNDWGYEDKVVYKRFFDHLDKLMATQPKDKPVFASVTTIYTHMGFKVPKEKRRFYPDAKTRKEHFSNCIYMADKDISVFFEELKKRPQFKNAIVIITGDHSYPLGGHGIRHAEVGFYEESFRIPFLLLWPGKIAPQKIKERIYSQVDIAPTLIDLIGLKVDQHHFVGRSMFAPPIDRPTLLIQPYSGTYTSVVRYPYKYIIHHRTRDEYLFNIKEDPEEVHNLMALNVPITQTLKEDVKLAFLNQQLIKENRVFPMIKKTVAHEN